MLRRHQHDRTGQALAEMYRAHATAAYRYAVHLTGSPEDADDLVQAAFLEAHRHLARGGAIVNPRAWFATVVRTRACNLRRDRHEAAASDRLETLAGALATDAGDAREDLDRVRAVLYELPEAQHQAFVLRYWSDLSYREIAAVLETTESAVESLLVRARAAIVAGPDLPVDCVAVRTQLSAGRGSAPAHLRHLDQCPRCRAARSRLARAAGIAAAVALVPRMHVAQALAASVPGFSSAVATGATTVGAGGTTLAAGKAGIAVKAAVAALAVAGSAAVVHAHARGGPAAVAPAASSNAPARTASAPATVRHAGESAPAQRADAHPAGQPSTRERSRRARRPPPGGADEPTAGTEAGDTNGQETSPGGDSQGLDQSGGDSGGGDSQGSDGSGQSQGDGSPDGGSSSPGDGNDDS